MDMDERQKMALAVRRVQEITGFYIHGLVFLLVNALLLVLNYTQSPDVWWVQWVFLGWGLGLLIHAIMVFGKMPNFITRWQMRKIKETRASL